MLFSRSGFAGLAILPGFIVREKNNIAIDGRAGGALDIGE
jgi:hypothetical protein